MNILFPIDGSSCSTDAAIALASRRWPERTVVKVVSVIPDELAYTTDRFAREEMRHRIEDSLERFVATLKEMLPDCRFECEIYEGVISKEIIAAANSWPSDLIIMASHDRHGLDRVLLGSVSQEVLMRSQCPVLIVKSNQHLRINRPISRVIIALDNSSCSVKALEWIASMPWNENTQMKLLSITDSIVGRYSAENNVLKAADMLSKWQARQSKNVKLLKRLAQKVKNVTGLDSVTVQIGTGDPQQAIIAEADSWGADLIVMGSHGRTGISKLLMGSVAQAVSQDAHCSVEVVKSKRSHSKIKSKRPSKKLYATDADTMEQPDERNYFTERSSSAFPAGLV